MPIHYFKKEQVSNPITGLGGVSVPFEPLPGNTGVLKLDDENALDQVLAEKLGKIVGRMGVVRISKEEFDDLKKKRLSTNFVSRSPQFAPLIRVLSQSLPQKPKSASPAVEDASPQPEPEASAPAPVASVAASDEPRPVFTPRKGKAPKIKAPLRVSMSPVHEEVVRVAP